jgi:hypothetical protein
MVFNCVANPCLVIYVGFVGIYIFNITCVFFESWSFPSFKIINPILKPKYHKCTFLNIETITKVMTFQKTKSYFIYVSFHTIENCKIIQKDIHEYINVFMKCFFYSTLINQWTIFHSKWHHYPNKCFPINSKSSFVLIFQCNGYLIISKKTIQKMNKSHGQQ